MPAANIQPPGYDLMSLTAGRFDHFTEYLSGGIWTSVISDLGSAVVGDGENGELVLLPSDASVVDNDEIYVKATNNVLKIVPGRAISFAALLKYSESNVNTLNVILGIMNAVAANAILDNGGGPKASFSGAVFYKIDGELFWRIRSSIGTTKTDTLTNIASGSGAWVLFEIDINDIDGLYADVVFRIDGQVVRDSNNRVVKHQVIYSGAALMQAFAGAKNGADTIVETVKLDAMYYYQSR